ncbi:hypothetical protein WJX74_003875 [Apatococcus lobatus]|uniref:ZZ-type domain-containing protein n=1 Tax=Apatococcus lobatus TaxID=904363 RepID=A0AAW1QKP5_9CHLO
MLPSLWQAQHECPICFQHFAPEDISPHCDTHFAVNGLVPEHEASDDEVVVLEPSRQQPATHNRRSASIPHRAQAQPPSRAVARDWQDVQSQNLAPLLCTSLTAQNTGRAHVVGYCRHFHTARGDSGWGCGWRNMQMLIAAMQAHSEVFNSAIFRGSGHVPCIEALQAGVQEAWQAGFDVRGAEQLDHRIVGTRKWVGTTEAAALLRSFGIRARIVDFTGSPQSITPGQAPGSSSTCHPGVQCDGCGQCPISGPRYHSSVLPDYDLCESCQAHPHQQQSAAPFTVVQPPSGSRQCSREALVNWVWRYFTGPSASADACRPPAGQPVVQCGRLPLYLQHQGHSRTIIGIQRSPAANGAHEYNLLLLDPGIATSNLQNALYQQRGWQRYVKRGMHTLNHPEYQIMYIEDGIAAGHELEELKIIRSTLIAGSPSDTSS